MLDLKFIRENSEAVRKNCERRGYPVDMDRLLQLDADARQLGQEAEVLRADRNRLSKECAKNPEAREQVKQLKEVLADKEAKLAVMQNDIREIC